MFLSAYLAIVVGQPVPEGFVPENTSDLTTFRVDRSSSGTSFDWSDTEDRVRGTLIPANPTATDELTISVVVGSFAGGSYEAPVSIGLRQLDGEFKQLVTVPAPKTEPRVWNASFVPSDTGMYQIEVAFRTTRQKSIKGKVEVGMGRVSKKTALGVGLGAIVLAIGYGLFILFVKKEGGTSEAPGPPTAP